MRTETIDGLVTLYYDGSEEVFNDDLHFEWFEEYHRSFHDCNEDDLDSWDISEESKSHRKQRLSWQQVIIVEGVTEIPDYTFHCCFNIKRVIFADTVITIGDLAFYVCSRLKYIDLSINLEIIGELAFGSCNLSSVFIPPSCTEIEDDAFGDNKNLSIFHVPFNTQITGVRVLFGSKLYDYMPLSDTEEPLFNEESWIKNINRGEKYSLHRVCCSFEPTIEDILEIVQEEGIGAFNLRNKVGITPAQYLKENPYAYITEKEIIGRYIMLMIGEQE